MSRITHGQSTIYSLLKGAFIDVQDAPAYVKVVPQFGSNNPLLPHGSLEDECSVSCLDVSSYIPTRTVEPPLDGHSGVSFGRSQLGFKFMAHYYAFFVAGLLQQESATNLICLMYESVDKI